MTSSHRSAAGKPKADYSIQAVCNAIRLLEAFSDEDEIGVSDLARRLDLHKNNVFRLLATLEERGYIDQSAKSERYRLGTRCLELGQAYAHGRDLLRLAGPVIREVMEHTGETVHLGVLRDFEVVHLAGEQPGRLVVTSSRVGMRLPSHCTALGKVLLGCGSEELRQSFDLQVARAGNLEAYCDSTITDPQKLFEHLRGVAVQRFAVDLEEYEAGMRCAAAPVYGADGQLLAALSISGPAFRLSDDHLLGEVVKEVCAGADRLSRGLGYVD